MSGNIYFITWLFSATAPVMLIFLLIYIPLIVIFSSPVRWYQEVPLFSLTEFAKWRSIEFLRPIYWALSEPNGAIKFNKAVLSLAYLMVPVFSVIGAISVALYVLIRREAKTTGNNRLVLIVYLALVCLLLLNQMRVRPGLWQGFPALVVSLPLIVLLFEHYKAIISRSKPIFMTIRISSFVIGAMLFNVGLDGLFQSTSKFIEFNTHRSSDIHVKPELKPYIDLVKYVQENTKSDEPIYSGVQDHSRLFINDAMLYFLTKRPPADRYLELEPGISNTLEGQEEIMNALKIKNVRLIVLSEFLSNEPNNTSRSNGITLLDEFIRANYHFDRSFGSRMVFVKE